MKDLRLPVREQTDGEEIQYRPPTVYRMRLPDMASETKKAPYILHQIVTGNDRQKHGQRDESSILVRSVFCVYHPMPFDNPDEEEGMLSLVEVTERWRIAVLKTRVLDNRYSLDIDVAEQNLKILNGKKPVSDGGGDGGRTTVIREIERTEERTVTRELTFTPEN